MIRMLYNNLEQYGDLDRTGDKNLVDDLDLETSVLISLFTERRAEEGDDGYETLLYKGGSWGDAVGDVIDRIGSRLWLMRRAKATQHNLNLAKTYIEEALQWLLDDGVAESIEVITTRGVGPANLRFSVDIQKPSDTGLWSRTWEIQFDGL